VTTEQNQDLKRFLIRIGVVTAAVLAILYVAKVWFFDQRPSHVSQQGAAVEDIGELSSEERAAGTSRIIPWQEAAKHYGEYASVEGTIVLTHNSGKACFLNFHPDYKRYFTAVIFASAFPSFPPNPEKYYYGKRVRVSGYIKDYKGKPEIILENPGQIEVLKK